jgi:hypothetical protein
MQKISPYSPSSLSKTVADGQLETKFSVDIRNAARSMFSLLSREIVVSCDLFVSPPSPGAGGRGRILAEIGTCNQFSPSYKPFRKN